MVVFPLIKLGSLFVRQISKPVIAVIKNRAKAHPYFKDYICLPPAHLYHWADVNIRMRVLGLGKATEVQRLNEEMAVELGAEMLGEFVIFSIAVGTIAFEYQRSATKERGKEEEKQQTIETLKDKVTNLDIVTEQQDTKIRELQRIVLELETRTTKGKG